jgi:hypothetical protein
MKFTIDEISLSLNENVVALWGIAYLSITKRGMVGTAPTE